jgi:hypothetical protein
MNCARSGITAAVLVGVAAAGMGSAVAQSPGPTRARTPAPQGGGGAKLSADAAAIYKHVKRRPGELNWQKIPWLADLPEAFQQAKAENRPILLWATDDDPLDRC